MERLRDVWLSGAFPQLTLCLSAQILWEITRFFLLAIELSVIILGLAFGMYAAGLSSNLGPLSLPFLHLFRDDS